MAEFMRMPAAVHIRRFVQMLGCVLLLAVAGCTPRDAASGERVMRITVDQGYISSQGEMLPPPVAAQEPDGSGGPNCGGSANCGSGNCGNFNGCSDPRALVVVAGVVVAVIVVYATVQCGISMYRSFKARPHDRPETIVLTFEAAGRQYPVVLGYGETAIRTDAGLEATLAGSEVCLHLHASGAWNLDQRIPVGRWPAHGRPEVRFTADRRVFVNGVCIR